MILFIFLIPNVGIFKPDKRSKHNHFICVNVIKSNVFLPQSKNNKTQLQDQKNSNTILNLISDNDTSVISDITNINNGFV